MNKTAYLLALIADDRVIELGIFSEPHPTPSQAGIWVTIDKCSAVEYGAAAGILADRARRGEIQGMGDRCAAALRNLAYRGTTKV